MASRAVPAVVPEGDGLGEGHIEPTGTGDARRHLGHLQGMGQPGALMVVGEDEDLGLAGQAPKGGGVQDTVAVAFEACAPRVGLLRAEAVAPAPGPGGPGANMADSMASRSARARSAAGPRGLHPAKLSA